jgi:hypothetical protein
MNVGTLAGAIPQGYPPTSPPTARSLQSGEGAAGLTIVVLAHAPYPLLLADLVLTSRKPNPHLPHSIPTLGTALPERGKLGARYLADLRQKLVSINPYLTIGWAGDLAAAHYVARHMRNEFAAKRVSYQEISSLLIDLGYRNGHVDGRELSLIGMISLDPGHTGFFHFGGHKGKIGKDPVYVVGTGTEHFFHYASKISAVSGMDRHSHGLEYTLGKFLGLTANVLAAELMDASSLKSFYGGGFEYVFPLGGTLQKLDDVTYSFWFVKSFDDRQLNLQVPPLFIKLFYIKDYVLIARVQFTQMRQVGDRPLGWAKQELHIVPPLLNTDPLETAALTNVEMSSGNLCSCFIFLEYRMPLVRVDLGESYHMFDIRSGGGKSRRIGVRWRPGSLSSIVAHARRASGEINLA